MEKNQETATWRGRPLRGVLFDLDGTLMDTASDIASALNRSFSERGLPSLPVSDVTRMIGRGGPMLIERAAEVVAPALTHADREALLERFYHHYGELEESGKSDAAPYINVESTLRQLHGAGLRLAVVTNKHSRFAKELLQRFELSPCISVLVGGDTCERRKPDPEPLLFACQSLGILSEQALMVGDSINDVQAARAAAIPVVCVPYGYNEGRDPRTLPCDALIDTLADLPGLLWAGTEAVGR
jgi:phosphoglycolate phosphatase